MVHGSKAFQSASHVVVVLVLVVVVAVTVGERKRERERERVRERARERESERKDASESFKRRHNALRLLFKIKFLMRIAEYATVASG